jgi:hypothetical protein
VIKQGDIAIAQNFRVTRENFVRLIAVIEDHKYISTKPKIERQT